MWNLTGVQVARPNQVVFKANCCLYIGTCNPQPSSEPLLHSQSCFLTPELRRCKNMKTKGRSMTEELWRESCKNQYFICHFVTLALWQIVTINSKFRLSGCKSGIESSLRNFLCNSRKHILLLETPCSFVRIPLFLPHLSRTHTNLMSERAG